MIRVLAVLVLVGAAAQGQANSHSDTVGYVGNLIFYKNQIAQDNQIISFISPSSFQARYGYWSFSADLFEPFYPTSYPSAPSDPETLDVYFDSNGFATLVGVVHPYIPELLADTVLNQTPSRPYMPPNPDQGVGIEFSYAENSFLYSSIIVLNSLDGKWFSSNDQAVVGQIQAQNGGTAITMVPEPSSLSLLALGGLVVALGRRKK
jgi:PEP-CTERM motif